VRSIRYFAILAALAASAAALAQHGVYYLTAPTENINFRTRQGAVLSSWVQGVPGESAVAVAQDIRTIGEEGGFQGSQYTLAGADTGTRYANPVAGSLLYDGTSDGANTYSIDYVSHTVYRMSSSWTGPAALFTAGGANGYLGITYDPTNN
jgi:hypothetical protein